MKVHSTKTICYVLIILIVGYIIYANREMIMGTPSNFGASAPGTKTLYIYNMCRTFSVYTASDAVSQSYHRTPSYVVQTLNNAGMLMFLFARSGRRNSYVNLDINYLQEGDIIYIIDIPTQEDAILNLIDPRFLIYRNGNLGGYINKKFVIGKDKWFKGI